MMAAAALAAAASLNAQTKPFSIKGITNGYEGQYLYLSYGGMEDQKLDSCQVKNGEFAFKGAIPETGSYGIITNDRATVGYLTGTQTSVMMSPNDMTVAINAYDPTHPVVVGSKAQLEDDEYESLTSKENTVLRAMNQMVRESKDDAYKEQLEKLMEPIEEASQKKSLAYVKSHPDTDKAVQVLNMLMGNISLDDAKTAYAALSERLKQTETAKKVADEIATRERIQPGKPAPDFTATDINGKKFTLSKLKGKYVVIDFWASWCVPCRKSNPHMKALYEKYGKKGLDFVYVADNDNSPEKWREAVKKDGLEQFHHVLRGMKIIDEKTYKLDRTNDISEKYAIHFLPTKYLIDKEGNMVGKFESDELDAKLKEIFGF